MFHIFHGAYQQVMSNPYQAQMPCQKVKPKVAKNKVATVIRIQSRRTKPVEPQALHKVLSIAATHTIVETVISDDEVVQDSCELAQDLIAAENLLHAYDAERDHFTQVTELLAALEATKKPYS
jgi:hypothetical protein